MAALQVSSRSRTHRQPPVQSSCYLPSPHASPSSRDALPERPAPSLTRWWDPRTFTEPRHHQPMTWWTRMQHCTERRSAKAAGRARPHECEKEATPTLVCVVLLPHRSTTRMLAAWTITPLRQTTCGPVLHMAHMSVREARFAWSSLCLPILYIYTPHSQPRRLRFNFREWFQPRSSWDLLNNVFARRPRPRWRALRRGGRRPRAWRWRRR